MQRDEEHAELADGVRHRLGQRRHGLGGSVLRARADVLHLFQLRREREEIVLGGLQERHDLGPREGRVDGGPEAHHALLLARQACDALEEAARGEAELVRVLDGGAKAFVERVPRIGGVEEVVGEQQLAEAVQEARFAPTARVVQLAERAVERVGRDLALELARGRLLEIVGFVEDDLGRLRQREGLLGLGEEDGVVRDDDVGVDREVARALQEAAAVVAALASAAFLGRRSEAVRDLRAAVELRQVARGGAEDPRAEMRQRQKLVFGQLGLAMREQLLEPAQAEVVRTPLDERGLERRADHAGDGGQVLGEDLLLQILRVGADDDRDLVRKGPQHGGDEVGDRLADAGARFDDEVALAVERLRHGHRHLVLLRTVLEVRNGALELAARLEPPPHVVRRNLPVFHGIGQLALRVDEMVRRNGLEERVARLVERRAGRQRERLASRKLRREGLERVVRTGGEELADDLHGLRGKPRGLQVGQRIRAAAAS